MTPRSRISPGELLVSIGLVALGVFVIVGTQDIPALGRYSQVGPRAFPYMIGAGLVIFGGMLCWQALNGGWRNMPVNETDGKADWVAFALLSTGVILHLASIGWAGFVLSSTFLFALIARAFGSCRPFRDIVIGLILSTAAFFIFTHGLGLNLPSGLLGGL
jgi:putative tricarboxylic transport membrane protein